MPGTPYDPDHFLLLVLSQKEGLTTRDEDEYIRKEIARNEDAAALFRDVQSTFPLERFELPRPRRPYKRAAIAAAVISIVLAGSIYSLTRKLAAPELTPVTAPVPAPGHKVLRIENKSIREIADIIKEHYKVEVYFDNEQVADYRFWGSIDTGKPIEEFLGDLHLSNGVEYAIDKDGNIHFK